MDFKVGLSAKPKKDAAIAQVASEGEKHLKQALKEVVEEIGMCMENARLVDQRVKEMAGQAAFEIEKKLALAGQARITRLARSLGFDVELDEDEPDDEEALASLPEEEETTDEAESTDDDGDDDDSEFSFDDDDDDSDDDSEFSFDDDDDDSKSDDSSSTDDDEDDDAFTFDDEDDDDDDDEEFKFD